MQQCTDLGAMDRIATILESEYSDIPSPSGYVASNGYIGRLPRELLESMYGLNIPQSNPNMVHTGYTRTALNHYIREKTPLPANIRDLVLLAMISKPKCGEVVSNYVLQEFTRSSQGQK